MNQLMLRTVLLLGLTVTINRAADVAFFGMIKSQEFIQTNATTTMARPTNGFAFNAFVVANSNHVVTNATVKPSNTTPLRTLIAADTNTLAVWRFEERFNSSAALDAAYPSTPIPLTSYTHTLYTVNDGTRTASLNYFALALLGNPSTPRVTNYVAAQSIDHTAPFVLGFNSSGNASIDLVQIIVTDTASNVLFSSPAPFSAGALTGASNTVVIPPYTLPAGTNLVGHLSFVRPVGLETNAYPGAIGVPAVLRDTEFPLITRPAPLPPVLEVFSAAPSIQLRYTGESNRTYRIEASENIVTWTNLLVTNVPSATITAPATLPHRFYRVHVGP